MTENSAVRRGSTQWTPEKSKERDGEKIHARLRTRQEIRSTCRSVKVLDHACLMCGDIKHKMQNCHNFPTQIFTGSSCDACHQGGHWQDDYEGLAVNCKEQRKITRQSNKAFLKSNPGFNNRIFDNRLTVIKQKSHKKHCKSCVCPNLI